MKKKRENASYGEIYSTKYITAIISSHFTL